MSGTILIGEKKALPLSTSAFDYLVDKIKVEFKEGDEEYRDEIYFPRDEGGMTFIDLRNQDEEGFLAFYRATERAYIAASEEDVFPAYEVVWRSLLDLLGADSRSGK